MRSERSPVPIWPLRSAAYFACSSSSFALSKRERITVNALARFLICDRSSAQYTVTPVGMWVIITAESVVLTCCPPAPEARMVAISRSCGRTSISTSSASGKTATVAVDVWIRPCVSVTGTRCTRCTPLSNFKYL